MVRTLVRIDRGRILSHSEGGRGMRRPRLRWFEDAENYLLEMKVKGW